MVMTIEERRWLVVGIVMNKVAAPVLRDYIKQGMDTHYTNLDTYCSRLAPPCTLTTLTYHQVKAHPNLRTLKFQNINKNIHLHGKSLYNHRVNDPVDLAKLYLPEYLAQFSAFDESLDISAILRLLGFSNPTPIFSPPNPFILIQSSADDVRNNVRNKWGHCNFSDWTEAFFKDCFVKLETLVRSLGLTGGKEKTVLDELSDWQTKGCQLCMGHAVDQQLLSLVRQDVKDLRANFVKTQAELSALQELVDQQRTEQLEVQDSISHLRVEHAATQVNLREHEEQIGEMKKWIEQQIKEVKEILEKLNAAEKAFEEEIRMRLQQAETRLAESDVKVKQLQGGLAETDEKVEQLQEGLAETDGKVEQLGEGLMKVEQLQEGLAKTDVKVEQLQEGLAKTDVKVEQLGEELMKVEQLQRGLAKTDVKVEQLQEGLAETDEKVEQLGEELMKVEQRQGGLCDKVKELELVVGDQRMKPNVVECRSVGRFDVETCRSKLAEHYRRTATVPTSVWSKTSPVDMQQIYTRLTWVKQEQTPEGTSKPELNHYTEVFDENENGYVSNRILVQGETGIGKTTFVKKMGLDWAELVDERTIDKQCQDARTSCEAEGSVNHDFKAEPPKEECIKGSANETNALKRFELVLVINLKEVSKYSSLRDVICRSNLFPEEDKAMAEQLPDYITNNQEKVLLVFDGYDEYRCGINSDIYEIFRGKKLRNCCVLITTRISKADDLLGEFKVVYAEITGFDEEERITFMWKMLGSKTDANELEWHLLEEGIFELARVPLLLLFFCTLWKKGKSNSFPETKTELYYAIVQYVLDHNQGKNPPARFHKVDKYKDILVEIGKVALECLLKDDHVFEFDDLSASINCEESRFIGLLQVTEFSENLRPAGMVSFIHKSIQEFLAAWYITNRCVLEGDLGDLKEHARSVEDCRKLENVFQFICGLSDDGARKVFEHMATVRISNSKLDIFKAVKELDLDRSHHAISLMVYDIYMKLLYKAFHEVQSKSKLLNYWFECIGGGVLVTNQLVNLLKETKVNNFTDFSDVSFLVVPGYSAEIVHELAQCLDCLDVPLRNSEANFTVQDFLVNLKKKRECWCRFTLVLLLRNGQFQFYVRSLKLCCDETSRLFTGTAVNVVQSAPEEWWSELRYLHCGFLLNNSTLKALSVVIRNCKGLESLIIEKADDCLCNILESIPNPRGCTLKIGSKIDHQCHLIASEAEKLAALLPRFTNILHLNLSLTWCCAAEVEGLVRSVNHVALKDLSLNGIRLTQSSASVLGRSLSEMSSLEKLFLAGECDGGVSPLKALFGGFHKTLPLRELWFMHFNIKGCIAPLSENLHLLPKLRFLSLIDITWNEHNLLHLFKNLKSIPCLETLSLTGTQQSDSEEEVRGSLEEEVMQASFTHQALRRLSLLDISLTSAVARLLGQLIPEMSALKELQIRGRDERILQDGEVEALFGEFKQRLPLQQLAFHKFSMKGRLDHLINSLQFFPHLQWTYPHVNIDIDFIIDDANFLVFLERLRNVPRLLRISIHCKSVVRAGCKGKGNTGRLQICSRGLFLLEVSFTRAVARAMGLPIREMSSLEEFTFSENGENTSAGEEIEAIFGRCHEVLSLRRLILSNVSLTPKAAEALGQCLPGMSSLTTLALTGEDGSVLQAEEMNALFGGFIKELPLCQLTFRRFCIRGCLAPLSNCLRFFPKLEYLTIGEVNMIEHNFIHLLRGVRYTPNLKSLTVEGKRQIPFLVCSERVETEVSLTLAALQTLSLGGITLNPAVIKALGRLLPEMSSLGVLLLTDGIVLQNEESEALPDGFNKCLPSHGPNSGGFSVRSVLAPLTDSFRFLPSMARMELDIELINSELCGFLGSDIFLSEYFPHLEILSVECKALACENCVDKVNTMGHLSLSTFEILDLREISLTPSLIFALGQAISTMSSLKQLYLVSSREIILQDEEVEALFASLNKTIPLRHVTFEGFRVGSCLTRLFESLGEFPNLQNLGLDIAFENENQGNVCGLLRSLTFLLNFHTLSVQCETSVSPDCTDEANTVGRVTIPFMSREIVFSGVILSRAVAEALGETLARMSALRTFKLIGKGGSTLNVEDMGALFGGFETKMPLLKLDFSGFCVKGVLAPLTESFKFFPNLDRLTLTALHLDEHDFQGLLENLKFIPELFMLDLSDNLLGRVVTSLVPHLEMPRLHKVYLCQTASEQELNSIQEQVKQTRPYVHICVARETGESSVNV